MKTQQGIDDIALEAKLRAVKGKVAIANAIAYQKYKEIIKPIAGKLCQQRCQCPATVVGQHQHQGPQLQRRYVCR